MARATVVFQPDGRRTRLGPGEDLLDAAQRCGVGLEDLCAGRGTCGKCKVVVVRGAEFLRPVAPIEARVSEEDAQRGIRLACQTQAMKAGLVILEIPAEAQRGRQRLQTSGWMPRFRHRPSVRAVRLPPRPTLARLRALGLRIPRGVVPALRDAADPAAPRQDAVVWEGAELLAVQPRGQPALGFAVDIGSTKLAGFLLDLRTGRALATVSAPNPQIPYGEDIMSRLAYAQAAPKGGDLLGDVLRSAVGALLRRACGVARVPADRVYHVSIVGNTAMHHFFLGLPVGRLTRAPYGPATRRRVRRRARACRLPVHPSAWLDAPPVIAGFVGSDLVAGVLATRMHRAPGLRVFIDIGTNTEICAGDRERLVACSAPSGPAFEGAHIRFGMRAAEGAIERVAVHPETLAVDYRTIGRGKPRGLCGSALVDLLADLSLAEVLDPTGKFRKDRDAARVRTGPDGGFVVVPAKETAVGQDIVLTQGDVGQIQLAKAAVRAGIDVLLDELGRAPSEIRRLDLAGAFGTYIAPESARGIGLFPHIPLDRVRFVGNTAGSGARLVLLSRDERGAMGTLAGRIEHVPLAGDPRFSTAFAASLRFPPRDAGAAPREVIRRRGLSGPPRR